MFVIDLNLPRYVKTFCVQKCKKLDVEDSIIRVLVATSYIPSVLIQFEFY